MKMVLFCKYAAIMMAAIFSITSCQKDVSESSSKDASSSLNKASEAAQMNEMGSGAPLKVDLGQGYLRVEDENGQAISATTPGSALLYETPSHLPILAPDGHHLTLAEFSTVSGWASIKCIKKGTHAVFHMKGLIPNGIYTMWIWVFNSNGFDGTLTNRIAGGAFGAPDASDNTFVANANGTASISIMLPEGNLSVFGSVPNCLSDVFEAHIIAAYHPDQQTHGRDPGPIWVGQFFFPVYGSQL